MERNNHHPFYNRADFRGKPLQTLRKLTVAKNVLIVPHNDLHGELPPPPMPSRPLAFNIVRYIENETDPHPLAKIFSTVEYLQAIRTPEAVPIAEHLNAQLNYLVGSYE